MDQSPARATTLRPAAFRDGLGERRRMADASGNEKLEVLCLRRELATVDSFETALRDRVNRLTSFRSTAIARVRAVERLNDPASTLVVVSEPIIGVRLSDLLTTSHHHELSMGASAEWCLIKQLTAAVCTLHQHGPDIAHGAIAPERIVITSQARVVVVEHVLGNALERLRLSKEQYWNELRVACPPSGVATRLDQRADITQVGVAALAVILGRPLQDNEYPAKIEELVAAAWARPHEHPAPGPRLRSWLARALQLDAGHSFTSAIEANGELDKAIIESGYILAPSDLEAFLALCQEAETAPKPAATVGPKPVPKPAAASVPAPPPAAAAPPKPAASKPAPAQAPAPQPVAKVATPAPAKPAKAKEPAVKVEAPKLVKPKPVEAPSPEPELKEIEPVPPEPARMPVGFLSVALAIPARNWRLTAAAAVLLLVLTGGGWAASRFFDKPVETTVAAPAPIVAAPAVDVPAPAPEAAPVSTPIAPLGPPPGHLEVRSNPPGAAVTIAGLRRGVTPLTIFDLVPGRHTVLIESSVGSTTRNVTVESGQTVLVTAELQPAAVAAPAAAATGSVLIVAPSAVDIFESGRLLGSSQSGRLTLPVGTHQLELVNQALGYRTVRSLQVTAGTNPTINLEFPKGTLALNAIPWAEVWVDGEKVGETPIGNLPVALGNHEVVFRNPDLGEQRMTATVTLTAPTRLSVDLRKR
jgi:hypothetical protein